MRDAPPQHELLTVVDDVAAEFAEQVVEAFHYRPEEHFTLALSGGPIAATCYERLATHAETQVDWWHVELFFADECRVDAEHPDCHERLTRTVLLDRVGAAHLVHPLRDEATVEAACAALEGRHLDLVHLDLGPDGRLSSLFPAAPTIDALFGPTRDPSGVAPHDRWSIGPRAWRTPARCSSPPPASGSVRPWPTSGPAPTCPAAACRPVTSSGWPITTRPAEPAPPATAAAPAPARLVGVDLARAVAIAGMVLMHTVGPTFPGPARTVSSAD